MDDQIPEGYESAEVTAAKNIVWESLDALPHDEDDDLIGAADRIVEDLLNAGIAIPLNIADPQAALVSKEPRKVNMTIKADTDEIMRRMAEARGSDIR